MSVAGVVRDEIEEDVDPVLARGGDQRVEVGERSQVRVDVDVVGDVVAPVRVRRRHDRVEPDPVDAEPREIVEPVGEARQVARERARVHLVEDALAPPRPRWRDHSSMRSIATMSSASNSPRPASPQPTMSPLGRIATGAITRAVAQEQARLVGAEGVLRPARHLGREPVRQPGLVGH